MGPLDSSRLSTMVEEYSGIPIGKQAPVVGENAFTHNAGLHVSAVLKDPGHYESIPVELLGRKRRFTLDRMSGMDTIREKMREWDVDLTEDQKRELLDTIKHRDHWDQSEAGLELKARQLCNETDGHPCDVSPQGKNRKIFTTREPIKLALAITPFNHPLNQVAHKIAPAIAAGVPMLVKPSEKTPLTAIRLAELMYEAGLPKHMLSLFAGGIEDVVEPLIADERVELVTFTGGTSVGKRIAKIAGYKKLCLELGGNSPLIILDDADMELAVTLAAEGCFRNSGQRCTAVKRLLVHEKIHAQFVERFVERAATYVVGDPADPATIVGTVIDEAAAKTLEQRVEEAVMAGAKVLIGGNRSGAQLEPTVIDAVARDAEMIREESFGPLAPIITIADLDDAISVANDSKFGLSSGVITNNMTAALECVRRIRTGTVNINQVPGYRIECSPFGGVKDSGLGIKEGVIEAMKFMTNIKTFSLPW